MIIFLQIILKTVFRGRNIVTDITDHFSQACMILTQQQLFPPLNNTKVRDYSNFNAGKFMTNLCEIDWNNTYHSSDVNKSFSRFYKNINHLINKHAPLKDVSRRRQKLLTKPWLTKGIRLHRKKIHFPILECSWFITVLSLVDYWFVYWIFQLW